MSLKLPCDQVVYLVLNGAQILVYQRFHIAAPKSRSDLVQLLHSHQGMMYKGQI